MQFLGELVPASVPYFFAVSELRSAKQEVSPHERETSCIAALYGGRRVEMLSRPRGFTAIGKSAACLVRAFAPNA